MELEKSRWEVGKNVVIFEYALNAMLSHDHGVAEVGSVVERKIKAVTGYALAPRI